MFFIAGIFSSFFALTSVFLLVSFSESTFSVDILSYFGTVYSGAVYVQIETPAQTATTTAGTTPA